MNLIVFDIGGTLMEYLNMPNVWIEYYDSALRHVREKLGLPLSDEQLAQSLEILRQYNPRVKYRERDYTPEQIFADATAGWDTEFSLSEVISVFFEDMKLTPHIYQETIPVLERLRTSGWKIAALTDVATGMPDELHKSYFPELLPYFDLYVSSQSCGFRKPNPAGVQLIAEHFGAQPLFFVGDELKDIQTGKNAGCRTVLIDRKNRGSQLGQDFTIITLDELLPICGVTEDGAVSK